MNNYSFYDRQTGAIHQRRFSTNDESQLEANTPENHEAIGGHHDHLSKRVDIETGEVVEYQPQAPSADHEWNGEAMRWQLGAAAAGKQARNAAARQRIAQLENSQHRHVREHCLGIAGAAERLKAIDDEIFSLRSQLQ